MTKMTPPFKGKKGSPLLMGAVVRKEGVAFRVWAPRVGELEVELVRRGAGVARRHGLARDADGVWEGLAKGARAGDRYFYVLDGAKKRPDPVSRSLPEGVHGPSEIVDPGAFRWSDAGRRAWRAEELSHYELHVGTFTREGTFAAAAEKIPYLKKLGVTCIDVMPVSQFPGARNWGYDGVSHYAVQSNYGGPDAFKSFVNRAHRAGLAVSLDVVYNHFGPEGNYLAEFGPYFTDKYRTPWGEAVNYDGPDSDPVRRYVIENARYWAEEYHVDALRLDAVHAICDFSAKNILEEIKDEARAIVIAESDLNDSRVVRPKKQGGFGLDGQWSDDFHHALHAILTGESSGYYGDFGAIADLAKAIRDAYVYDGGRYSNYRKRRHGNSAAGLAPRKFVVSTQNHDQVGNRALGDRLSASLSFEQDKLAASVLLLSPFVPLLFMGQEYREKAPFQYFVDHGDPALAEAVRKGRAEEFASFGWQSIPDPKDEKTFQASKLRWNLAKPQNKRLLALYTDLLALRRTGLFAGALTGANRHVYFDEERRWLAVEYPGRKSRFGWLASFSTRSQRVPVPFLKAKRFEPVFAASDKKYGGAGSPAAASGEIELGPFAAIAGKIR